MAKQYFVEYYNPNFPMLQKNVHYDNSLLKKWFEQYRRGYKFKNIKFGFTLNGKTYYEDNSLSNSIKIIKRLWK